MISLSRPARRARRVLRLAAGVCGLSLPAAGQGVVPLAAAAAESRRAVRVDTLLDLPTVIARAIAVNPLVASGESSVRVAQSETRVAQGAYLPSLAATSTAVSSNVVGPAAAAPATGSAYSAGLASSIELFTGGRRGADQARARADLGAAEATNVSQRFAVTLAASRAFYESLRGSDLLAVASARVTRAERGLRYAQDRARAGTATKSDELRARLELTTGRQQLLAARDTAEAADYALGRIVGADGPVGALRPASLGPRPLALDDTAVVRLAVDAAPSVQAAEATARATSATIRAARSQYLPDLRLTGGYNVASQTPLLGTVRPGWTVAVGTSFPLFNGFQREDAVTRAQAANDVAQITALDARRQVRAESARLLGALRLATENIALAAEAVSAAQEDLRVQTERYRAGISTSLDRLTSELAVTQAELGLVAARYSYQVTRATLEALVGRSL
jgi:outer membrane protein TolC